MTRRFEFVRGNSAKFWQVTQEANQITVHYGRLGSTGQTQSISFASNAAAQAHADKQIAQKLGKGYVEAAG